MPKRLDDDEGYKPDTNGLSIMTSRLQDDSGGDDSQSSPPVSKKARILSSVARDSDSDVIDTVKKAVLGSDQSVAQKHQQISRMIAELQNLQKGLHAVSKEPSNYPHPKATIPPADLRMYVISKGCFCCLKTTCQRLPPPQPSISSSSVMTSSP